MKRNKLSEAIHWALWFQDKYFDMPKYKDGTLYPIGIWVMYA